MNLEIIATGASGIAWTIVYLALIYRGLKDKSYGMPLVPLALNFAWEFVFSILYPPENGGMAGRLINMVWMVFDIGIVFSYFRYSYAYFLASYQLKRTHWLIVSLSAFFISFGVMIFGGRLFGSFDRYFHRDIFQGAIFIAYVQNLIMSICFLLMLWERRSVEGQSMTIAIFKCIGTSLSVGVYYLFSMHHGKASLMNLIILSTFIFDLVYIFSLYRQFSSEGIHPWTRKRSY